MGLRSYFPTLPFVVTVATAVLILPGCDIFGASAPDDEDASDGGIDVEATAETIPKIESAVASAMPPEDTPLEDRNLHSELVKVADAVRSVSGIDSVVVHDALLSATAYMESGLPFMITNNRPSGAPVSASSGRGNSSKHRSVANRHPARGIDSTASMPKSREPTTSTKSSSAPSVLPNSRTAVVATVDGGASVAGQVESKLQDAGYKISSLGASLQDMRNYDNVGVLYLDTHMGSFYSTHVDSASGVAEQKRQRKYLGLQTSTTVQPSGQWVRKHLQALKNRDIVMGSWGAEGPARVAVTGSFIRKNWNFAKNGFAFIHTCYLGANQFWRNGRLWYPTSMRQGILQSATALITFDNFTLARYAEESITTMFDLLLGQKEEEYGRAWNLQSARGALSQKGLNKYHKPGRYYYGTNIENPWSGHYVSLTYHGSQSVQLAPSIRRIQVVDDAARSTGRLKVKGQFGKKKGKVLIDGSELNVEQWDPEQVVAESPFSGAKSTGSVRLKVNQQVESNTVNLTKWNGQILSTTHPKDTEQLTASSVVDVVFRADLHASRDEPLADPSYPPNIKTYISPASEGTLEGKGSRSNPDGSTDYWEGTKSYSILGKKQVDAISPKASATGRLSQSPSWKAVSVPTQVGGTMHLKPKKRSSISSAEMCLQMAGSITSRRVASDGSTTEQPVPITPSTALIENGGAEGSPGTLACLPMEWGGPKDRTMTRSKKNIDFGGHTYEIQWTYYQAQNLPE